MTIDEKTDKLLQNFCYDTENISLYTNKESAPRLFALLDSLGFVWASGERAKPIDANDLIFLYYDVRQICHLSTDCMFNTDYHDVIYFSAKNFLDLLEKEPPF